MKEMFEGLAAFCEDARTTWPPRAPTGARWRRMGYPQPFVGVRFPAFDLVSDYFRSLRGSTLDMYRQPDKLLAMIDVMLPASIDLIIGACKATNTTRAFIPMHRGAGGFMSDEQFEKFYWPSFSALIYACIENGITPMPLFEGDYTPRLKYLATLPPGKVAAHFDKIDRKKFKEMCGDVMCFWGNVPPSLLVHRHAAAGQGRRQGAHRHLRRPADHRQHRRHPRRGQARERPGAQGSRRRVWRPLRRFGTQGRTPSSPHSV